MVIQNISKTNRIKSQDDTGNFLNLHTLIIKIL